MKKKATHVNGKFRILLRVEDVSDHVTYFTKTVWLPAVPRKGEELFLDFGDGSVHNVCYLNSYHHGGVTIEVTLQDRTLDWPSSDEEEQRYAETARRLYDSGFKCQDGWDELPSEYFG